MRKRIQKSMMFILIAILVPIYLIMSVGVYQRNLKILEGEIKQEASYIKRAVDLSGTEYLAQLDDVDQGTRVTLIASTGEVLYDSRNDGSTMENHKTRAEVQQALKNGTGEKIRMSDTVRKELYYYAVLLDDGNVLRVSKSMDSLMWTSLNILPVVIGIGIIGLVLAWFLAKWQTNRLMEPVIHLDLENPLDNVVYEEMTPLLEAMDKQNKEKEAVANMRKEFSANVSHELKTPLTSISGYAEIMMNGLVRPEDIPRFSETIYKEARRLLTLIEDIIKISKLDDESVELEKEDVDLFELTREIVSRLSLTAAQRNIHMELTGESVKIHGIRQILDDGNVLRVSKSMDSLMWTSLNILPVVIGIGIIGLVLAWFLAKWQTNRLMEPVIHLDLENPLDNVVYEEMTPLLEAMDKQNKEKEAVANMRKEFSANVSHELKTPLTSISGYAEIMMNGLVRPEDIPRFSETIYKEARRLLTLIEDIIKISKLDDESVELEKEDVDLFELTREIVSRLSLTAAQRNIHMELTGESVKIHGIRQILDEMIYNITENAVKYNKENGNVTIWVGNTLEGPKVRVSDTGIGIPKEHQDRIFERFYRVDKSHSKERGGTGLGLSIVKHGAILHGAKVQVDSEYGKGTRMEIIFPGK